MYEILTNPVTLLCLGVIFLLISVLFFYFRRSLSVLERAQMEQARILQSFITNMEMTQQMAHQRHVIGGDMNTSNNVNTTNEQFIKGTSEQILIDVSDENGSDSDDSDSDDSDSEESDSEESDQDATTTACTAGGTGLRLCRRAGTAHRYVCYSMWLRVARVTGAKKRKR